MFKVGRLEGLKKKKNRKAVLQACALEQRYMDGLGENLCLRFNDFKG